MIRKTVITIFFLITVQIIYCHPHGFIDAYLEFFFNCDSLQGIKIFWMFDEIFSSSIILDYDLDKNNYLDQKENNDIYNNIFLNIHKLHYFTFIELNAPSDNQFILPPNQISFEVFKNEIENNFGFPDQKLRLLSAYKPAPDNKTYDLRIDITDEILYKVRTVLDFVSYIEINTFRAFIDKNRLVFSYFVPCVINLKKDNIFLKVKLSDPSRFYTFKIISQKIKIMEGFIYITYKLFFHNSKKHTVFKDIYSNEIVIMFKRKEE